MLRNFRFFVFSNSSLDFREVRFFKTKVIGSGLLVGLMVLALLFLLNHFTGDLLGFGYNRMSMLSLENRILKEQIRELSGRMAVVQKSLDRLYQRGNELRLIANLSSIDEDTRSAAIGGTSLAITDAFLTGEAGKVLGEAETLIHKLMQEVRLQRSSYEEISRQFQHNKGLYACMPAIKPMAGYYSINGFGMRIHPVLQVYRMHPGVDIANEDGTKIYAAGDGVVRFAGRTQGGYGVVVEITHGYGYTTLYAHLAKPLVRQGQIVQRG